MSDNQTIELPKRVYRSYKTDLFYSEDDDKFFGDTWDPILQLYRYSHSSFDKDHYYLIKSRKE